MHLSIQHAGLLTSLIGGAGGNSPLTTSGGEDFSSLLSSLLGIGIKGDIETVQALKNSPLMIPAGSVSGKTAFAVKPGVLPTAAPVTRVVQSGESASAADAAVEMMPAVITVQSEEGKVIDIPVLVGRLDISSGDTTGSSEGEITASAGLLVILNPTVTPLPNAGEGTAQTDYTYMIAELGDGSRIPVPAVSHTPLVHTDAALGDGTSHADGLDSSGKQVIANQESGTHATQPRFVIESPAPSSAEIPRNAHIGPQKSDAAGNQTHAADTPQVAGTTRAVGPGDAEAVSTQTKAVNALDGMPTLVTRMTFEAVSEARPVVQSTSGHESSSPAEAVTKRATHSSIDAEIIGDTAARNSDVSNEADIMVFRTPDGHATLSVPSSRVAATQDNSILRLLEALTADGGRVEAVFTVLSDDTGALSNTTGSPIVPFDAHAVQTAASKAVANTVESVNAGAAPDDAVSPEPIRIVIDYGDTVFRYRAPRIETADSVRAGQPIAVQSTASEHERFAVADTDSAAETATKPSRVGIPELQPEVVSRTATVRHDSRAEETLFAVTTSEVVNDATGTDGADTNSVTKNSGVFSEENTLIKMSSPNAEKTASDVRAEAHEVITRPIRNSVASMKTDYPATHESKPEAVDAKQKPPTTNDSHPRSDIRRSESSAGAGADQPVPPHDDSAKVIVPAGQRSVRYVDNSALTMSTASASDSVIPGDGASASAVFRDDTVPAADRTQFSVETESTGAETVQRPDAKQSIDLKAVRATAERQTVRHVPPAGDITTAPVANDIPENVTTVSEGEAASDGSADVAFASKTAVPSPDAPSVMKPGQTRGDGDTMPEPVVGKSGRATSVVDGRAGRIVHERHEATPEPIASRPGTDTASAEPVTEMPGAPQSSARAVSNDSASAGLPSGYTAPDTETAGDAPDGVSAGSGKTSVAADSVHEPRKTDQAESQPSLHSVKTANKNNPAQITKPSAYGPRDVTGIAAESVTAVETPELANPGSAGITADINTVRRIRTEAAAPGDTGASETVVSASAVSAGSTRVPAEAESRNPELPLAGTHRHDRIHDSPNAEKGNHSDRGPMDGGDEKNMFDTTFAAGKNAAATTPDGAGMTAGFESAVRSSAPAESENVMDKGPAADSAVHVAGQRELFVEHAAFISESSKTLSHVSPDYDEKILSSIVRQATLMVKNGQSSAVIRLEPPSLGKLKIEIVTEQSKITGRITVESNEVKQIVENRIAELRHNLNQNGLKVESFDVHVGHNGGADAWAHRENKERGMRTTQYGAFGGSRHNSSGAAATAATQTVRTGIHHTGMIDVMI